MKYYRSPSITQLGLVRAQVDFNTGRTSLVATLFLPDTPDTIRFRGWEQCRSPRVGGRDLPRYEIKVTSRHNGDSRGRFSDPRRTALSRPQPTYVGGSRHDDDDDDNEDDVGVYIIGRHVNVRLHLWSGRDGNICAQASGRVVRSIRPDIVEVR